MSEGTRHRRFRLLVAMALVAGITPGPTTLHSSAQTTSCPPKNTASDRLVVYNFNIHQLDDEWTDWVDLLRNGDEPVPDVLLLQEIENSTQRHTIQNRLTADLCVTYRGANSHVRDEDAIENEVAILWRDRLEAVPKPSGGYFIDDESFGYGGNDCGLTKQSPILVVKLRDRVADKVVTAASFKTDWGGTEENQTPEWCPWRNTQLVNDKLIADTWKGHLALMGTDANSHDYDEVSHEYRCWYRGTVENMQADGCSMDELVAGYKDPIFAKCGDDRVCLEDENYTHGKPPPNDRSKRGRIDFIFVKRPGQGLPNTTNRETLPRGNATCNTDPQAEGARCYSDHRSIRATIIY